MGIREKFSKFRRSDRTREGAEKIQERKGECNERRKREKLKKGGDRGAVGKEKEMNGSEVRTSDKKFQ